MNYPAILALSVLFITPMVLSKDNSVWIPIHFQISQDSQITKMGLWICSDPKSYSMGVTVPLTQTSSRSIPLNSSCKSFGFYPLPYPGTGAYVKPAITGINTINYIIHTTCTLTFNSQVYTLDYGSVVNINHANSHKSNDATITCKKTRLNASH